MLGIYRQLESGAMIFEGVTVPTVSYLFENMDSIVSKLKDNINIHYSLGHLAEGVDATKRKYSSQDIIAFDIDGCEANKQEDYIHAVTTALNIDFSATGIVSSGNGYHFIIHVKEPIVTKEDDYKKLKPAYLEACDKIDAQLSLMSLKGKADRAVWSPARTLRLGFSVNKKAGKPLKNSVLLQAVVTPQEFSLDKIQTITPTIGANRLIEIKPGQIDSTAVLSGCNFLRWCKENPESVTHEQWFPMCAITYTIDPTGSLTHSYSSLWSRYDKSKVDQQLSYLSYEKSNVTCERVESVWGSCIECPNYCKVKHPTDIKRESFFASSTSGYRELTAKGGFGKPDYEDLYRFFIHQNIYITIDTAKELYFYSDGIWKREAVSRVKEFVTAHLIKSRQAERSEFVDLVMSQNLRSVSVFERAGSGLVNFKNGVLDLETGELHPHDPKYGFRWQLEFDYDPTARATKYESMMELVCGGDKEKLALLQEIGGYIVSGTPPSKHQKFFMLFGEGANGKTTFFYAIAACLGRGAYTSKKPLELAREEGRAALVGKLLNFCDETPRDLFNSEALKQLATGSPISYRNLYSESAVEELIAKHMFACNELPRNSDSTHGLMRKTIIVPFTVTIAPEDQMSLHQVQSIFKSEAAGIFNSFYEGYKRLERNAGFSKCKAVDDALEVFKVQSDSVREWANECVVRDDGNFTSIETMYHSYKDWCQDSGARPKSKKHLGMSLSRIFGKSGVKKIDKRSVRGYDDIKTVDVLTGEDTNGINRPGF